MQNRKLLPPAIGSACKRVTCDQGIIANIQKRHVSRGVTGRTNCAKRSHLFRLMQKPCWLRLDARKSEQFLAILIRFQRQISGKKSGLARTNQQLDSLSKLAQVHLQLPYDQSARASAESLRIGAPIFSCRTQNRTCCARQTRIDERKSVALPHQKAIHHAQSCQPE